METLNAQVWFPLWLDRGFCEGQSIGGFCEHSTAYPGHPGHSTGASPGQQSPHHPNDHQTCKHPASEERLISSDLVGVVMGAPSTAPS